MISIFFLSFPHFRKRKCFSENQYFHSYSPAHLFFFFYAIPQIIFVFNILKYFHFLASKSCLSSSPPLLACCCLWQQNSGFLHTKAMSSFSALFGMAAIFLGPHYGCKWDQYSLSHTHNRNPSEGSVVVIYVFSYRESWNVAIFTSGKRVLIVTFYRQQGNAYAYNTSSILKYFFI